MKWSEQAWAAIDALYGAILEQPFIRELASGSLSMQRFRFYMAQDSFYLEHFGRALSLIAARAQVADDALAFMRFAENAIVVEQALHASYFRDFGLEDRGEMQPVCHHYVHFLRSTAALEAVEVAMAAVLPCFWIYKRVGDHICAIEDKASGNPYQRWIDTYGGEAFGQAVQQSIDICDRAAAATSPTMHQRMTEHFVTAARMEYYFWEAAYKKVCWV